MKIGSIQTIEDLGYDNFFESNRLNSGLDGFTVARVTAEHKGSYTARNLKGEYTAKITGKQMFNAESREDFPAVGDWVVIEELNQEQAVILGILPRKTVLKRKKSGGTESQVIATNIDTTFIVESLDRDYNLNRIERYAALAKDGGIECVVVLNKTDLLSAEESNLILEQTKARLGLDVVLTSTKSQDGLSDLRSRILHGKTYCFLGSSGVGKSSVIKEFVGDEGIRTQDISQSAGRGKHTTTSRELFFLANGGILIDNPGMREVGIVQTSSGVEDLFAEISQLAQYCNFSDCTHVHEPGCSVRAAVEAGNLDGEKYKNYLNLKKEAEYHQMSELERREKDRKFGRMFKNAKKDFKDFKHKNY